MATYVLKRQIDITEFCFQSFKDIVGKAFDDFVTEHNNFNTNQLRFIEILKGFILDKGEVTKKDLVKPPFTQFHSQGILGVFQPKEINEIVNITKKISA